MPRKSDYSGARNSLNTALFEEAVEHLYAEDRSSVFALGHSCVKVCAALLAHMDSDGKCYPGRNAMAALAGISPNTVTACVKKLEDAGIVRVERRRERLTTRCFYQFVHVEWAKTMTWTSEETGQHQMNTEQSNTDKPTNWVEFAIDWMERNVLQEGSSRFAGQIRTACEQRGVDDLGTAALLNFSSLFPEVPFVRGMWMGVGNVNVRTLVLLRAYDIRILHEAVQLRRNMLSAMQEEITPPAHPLQLQSFLAQAVAKADAAASRQQKSSSNSSGIEQAGYVGSSDLDF
jgi:hypothetical protein